MQSYSSTSHAAGVHSTRLVKALQLLCAAGGFALAGQALAAPVVITPGDLQGWVLSDGRGSATPSNAQITGTQAYQGNGSLQFDIANNNQQPLAYHAFTPVSFGSLMNGNATFGFSYMLPVGSPPATSPTIRLLLTGLTNSGQAGRSDGSLGWYLNGAGDGLWHTDAFSMSTGDFFFRLGGLGQAATSCATGSQSGNFDDRRQTLNAWAAQCTGAGGSINLDNAMVTGIEVDWGTFTTTFPVTAYVDRINYSVASNVGDFNFEVRADVPEPASIALSLLALGFAGTATVRGRKQRRNTAC